MNIYKVYSPNNILIKTKIFNNKKEAYDYYDNLIMEYSFKTNTKDLQFVLECNGKIIDSGSFIN